ncbi:hypothetical protein CCP2SC5_1580002 [Azospirillaceae bacterium]
MALGCVWRLVVNEESLMSAVRSRVVVVLLALSICGMSFAITRSAVAATIDTSARQVILTDLTTNTILFEKNARQKMATSSMSKIMSMYMVFEALKSGRLSLEDTLPVKERVADASSKMFAD